MKSLAVFEDSNLELVDVPVPQYGDYEALVKVESCGVCNGTDLKLIHKEFKNFDTYPALLGHEGIGRVVKLGPKVTSFKVGDLVTLPFIGAAPEGYHSGWGTYSDFNIVSDHKAKLADGLTPDDYEYAQLVIPDNFDPVSSAMIVTFREVLSEALTFGFKANQSVFIQGLGPVGMSFIKFAKLLGMGPIVACDLVDEKLEEAVKMGADHVVNGCEDVIAFSRSICPDGFDHVVDAVGINSFINTAMEMITHEGSIDVYGISPKLSYEIDWSKAPYNWNLKFSQWPDKKKEGEAHRQICAWIEQGVLDPSAFVSHVVDFEDAVSAFKIVEDKPSGLKKIIIKM